MKYIGYGHDKPGPTDAEVAAKPTMSAYIVTENLECGTLKDKVLNQVLLLPLLYSLFTGSIYAFDETTCSHLHMHLYTQWHGAHGICRRV